MTKCDVIDITALEAVLGKICVNDELKVKVKA